MEWNASLGGELGRFVFGLPHFEGELEPNIDHKEEPEVEQVEQPVLQAEVEEAAGSSCRGRRVYDDWAHVARLPAQPADPSRRHHQCGPRRHDLLRDVPWPSRLGHE